MHAQRLAIPTEVQKQILQECYSRHLGMSRMKILMRSYVYCPIMDRDIENCVKSCKGYALAAKASPVKYQSQPEADSP